MEHQIQIGIQQLQILHFVRVCIMDLILLAFIQELMQLTRLSARIMRTR